MSTGAETWLFDLGNSRLKAARLAGAMPTAVFALDWGRPDCGDALAARLAAWPQARRVLVASVASPASVALLRAAWPDGMTATVEWLRTPREACGVRNGYRVPERLGIDRFLALVALRAAAGAGVVVGCGTALTLDALAGDGVHAEGLIAPSPRAMLEALRDGTAIAQNNPDAFAAASDDDTARALQAGCWSAAGALVEWFAAKHAAAGGAWLHGGWAPALATWLQRDGGHAQILDHAVLRGLAVWAVHSA